jgi:hypothetical protein
MAPLLLKARMAKPHSEREHSFVSDDEAAEISSHLGEAMGELQDHGVAHRRAPRPSLRPARTSARVCLRTGRAAA